MADSQDIPKLIETDARIFLRNSERYRFLDSVSSDSGPYVPEVDYVLGDVVGIYDESTGITDPVRVVEIVTVLEPGSVKKIPTFSSYTEKDPSEQ